MDERVLIYESTLTEIADAIREKRQTEEEILVTDMAEEILAIQVGVDTTDGTAAAEDVLVDKVAYVNEQRIVGTMANNGTVDVELSAGESYSVPVGYHDGEGAVRAKDLASQTEASAAAEDILSGQTAWVDGEQITGTMVNNGAVAPSALAAGGSYTIPKGYHDGTGKVSAQTLASQTDGDATAAMIQKGKTAWVDGAKVTGTLAPDATKILTGTTIAGVAGSMKNNGAVAPSALAAGGSYTIPQGYHDGSGKVTVQSLAAQTSATANSGDILYGRTAWVNGSKLTGGMPSHGAVSTTLNAGQSYTIPAGFHNGSGKVTTQSMSNLASDAIIINEFYSSHRGSSKMSMKMTKLDNTYISTSKSYGFKCNVCVTDIPSHYYRVEGTIDFPNLTLSWTETSYTASGAGTTESFTKTLVSSEINNGPLYNVTSGSSAGTSPMIGMTINTYITGGNINGYVPHDSFGIAWPL